MFLERVGVTLLFSDYNEEYYKTGYQLKRWHRMIAENPDCTGEYYEDRAKKIFDTYGLKGKKVLDIGCGFGFTVADLREMGADAYGIDISEYATKEANTPYVVEADARTKLKDYKDQEFDLVIMCEFLHCLTDTEIASVCKEVKRIAKNVFVIERRDFDDESLEKYNPKTMLEWEACQMDNLTIVWREEESKWQQSR